MFRLLLAPAVALLAYGGCGAPNPAPYQPPVHGQVGVCFGIPGGCPK